MLWRLSNRSCSFGGLGGGSGGAGGGGGAWWYRGPQARDPKTKGGSLICHDDGMKSNGYERFWINK